MTRLPTGNLLLQRLPNSFVLLILIPNKAWLMILLDACNEACLPAILENTVSLFTSADLILAAD